MKFRFRNASVVGVVGMMAISSLCSPSPIRWIGIVCVIAVLLMIRCHKLHRLEEHWENLFWGVLLMCGWFVMILSIGGYEHDMKFIQTLPIAILGCTMMLTSVDLLVHNGTA